MARSDLAHVICRQMQTYASDCKKIKFSDCLDEGAQAAIRLFQIWLLCDGLAICPTHDILGSHILGELYWLVVLAQVKANI